MKRQAFDLQKSRSCVEHNNRAKYWLNTSHFTGFVDHEKAVDSIYIEPRWKSMMVHEMQQKIIQFIKSKYKDNSLCGKCIVYARNKNRFWVRVFFFFLWSLLSLLTIGWIREVTLAATINGDQWTLREKLDDLDLLVTLLSFPHTKWDAS